MALVPAGTVLAFLSARRHAHDGGRDRVFHLLGGIDPAAGGNSTKRGKRHPDPGRHYRDPVWIERGRLVAAGSNGKRLPTDSDTDGKQIRVFRRFIRLRRNLWVICL